jgi:multidrug efflux pump subunit AcrA (membrane-fusion protein)
LVGDSRVTFISPQVEESTQSVLVKATLENGAGLLRTSQFVRAKVVWSERQGPVLPITAVKHFNGQSFAFAAVQKNGKLVAEQRPVSLGPIDGAQYPLEKGLTLGDSIVVSGLQKLHDGMPIAQLTPKG